MKYFKPNDNITTSELLVIMTTLISGIVDSVNERTEDIVGGRKPRRLPIDYDINRFTGSRTLIVSEYIIESLPANLRGYFSPYQ